MAWVRAVGVGSGKAWMGWGRVVCMSVGMFVGVGHEYGMAWVRGMGVGVGVGLAWEGGVRVERG